MKLTIPTKTLATALKSLSPVAKASRTHPILGNVAIIAEKKGLRLIAMDLEKRMELFLSCKVKEQGSITLNCAYLTGLLSSRSEPECEISTKDDTATLRIGRHIGTRPGLPIEEMPTLAESAGEARAFTIPATLLNECLTKSLVQAGTMTGERAFLNSVFIVSREGQLNIQATNGQRLIIFYTPVPFEHGDKQSLVPRESVSTLANLASEGDVEVSISDNVLTASTESTRFTTLLIDHKFQDFEKVFRKDSPKLFTCNREQFLMEIRSAVGYTSEMDRTIVVNVEGDEIKVTGSDAQTGNGVGSLDAKKGSDAIEFHCNPDYLADALNAFPEEEVVLRFTDERTPFVIKNELITAVFFPKKG